MGDSDWKALAEKAGATSVRDLKLEKDRDEKEAEKEEVRRDVMRELREQGIHVCQHCTMPNLDPDDPQFAIKRNAIISFTRRGIQLQECSCGESHVTTRL